MALGIFANCVFFVKVNHLPVQDKKRLKTCIKENGGIISFVLNKKCTHVIVEHTGVLGSRHLQNIKNNHIPILRADFIWKCVEEKLLLKTDDYCHNIACEIVAEKETHNKDKDNNQILQETTEKNTKKIDKKRIYIESDPDLPNFHQDFEVAKYAALEKTLENLPKEVAVIELQCLKGQVDSPFQLEIQMGLSNGVQKKQNYLQFDTSEQACEKYHVYIEDLKKKGFKLRKGIPKEAVHLASEKLQELLLQDEINATSVSQEISTFVELIWVEALGHLDHILCHPVNSISLNDVSKGEGILLQVRKALDNGETMDTLITIMSEFYRIIPHKHGLDYTINKKLLSTKQDLCQLIRDIVSVCETNMSRSNPPSLAKYHALRCMIEHISPSSEEFLQVKQQVLEKNHSNSPLKVLNIYRVGRLGEAAQFESNLGNVQSLLHASTASNYVGILSRGLLLPKIVVEDHGVDRTDIGNLGSGIYFSDSISTSLKYSAPTKTDGSRLLVVCDVALGNCLDLHRKDYSLTNAPSGFHSVHGIRKTPGVFADFEDDEFVVYKTSQVKIKYIVNFCTTEDHIEEFCPDVHVAASEEMLSNPSDVPVQPEETLTDIKPLDEITGGLLDLSGNQIPLEGVYIKGKIIDFIAQVVVFQTYRNQCTVPIEAKYVFPLDSTSAVCGFEAFINGKHIIGKVKEKQQAHREYREAISQGHGAYLMDQDAADVFTVSVGNLPPKATVFIKITYITELQLMYGSMVFEVPGAVAPWQQDSALNENTQDTVEKVCVTGAGAEKGAFSLDLSVEMPFTISGIWSRTHSIKMKKTDCKAVVTTAKNSSLEIYGFSLMIDLSEPYLPRMWVERHPDKESEACMLVFQPDFDTDSHYDELEFNEIIICLDCSNSMSSVLQQAKKIALLAVNTFNFESKLNFIKFGTRYEEFSSYSEGVIDKEPLEKFIKSAKPTMGNTDLWKLLHSLSLLAPCKGIRNILLISDGHIQEESRTFQIIKNNVKHTRLFTCGVGPTANRHMLRSLSQYGGGAFEYFDANSKYNWKSKVAAQLSRTEYAGCNSVSVKWQQFNADAPEPVQAPAHIQSVFNTEKVLVYGFVPHCTQATLHALLHNQEINTMVSTTELQKTTGTILHKLTAKALIRDYEDGILHEKESEHEMKKQMLKSMIIELSKEYSIVTQFTSFVAIEQRDTNESQADMLNIQDLLAVEDVDFLPYMTWEKDIHSRRKRRKANMSNDMEPTCDVPLSDSSANIMETDEEPLIGGKLDMLTCEQPTCELYDVILASDEEPLSDSMLDMTVIDMLPTSASEGDAIYDDDEEDAECSSALRRPTFTGKSDMPVFFTKMMSAPSAGIYALKSPKSASPLSETQPPPPPPPPAPQASQPLAAALFRCRSEEISFESVPPPSGVFLPESMLQPIAGEQRRIEREGFVQLNLEEQHDRFDLAFSETSRRVAQKPDSVSYQHDSVIVPRFPLPGSTLFDIRKSPSTSAGFIGMSFPTASSASRRQEASSEATATEYSMFVPQAPPIFTNNVLLRSMPFSSSAATAPVQREIDKVTVIGFGSSSSVSGSSMFGVPPCGEAFKRKPHFRALRKKSSFQRVTSEMPSWSALFLLQTPNHYWELSPELGTALNVNVSYLINVFLVQKGLQSLGLKGREEVLQLIATLLVLQAMYFTQKQGEITFKSLMKLDESSIKNDFYFRLQKVMEWARNVDRQYPAICSRLGLGKDWNSATRQLLGVDPIEANSSLDKAFLHC